MTVQLTLKRWTEIVIIAACIFLFGVSEGRRRALRQLSPSVTANAEQLAQIQRDITETQEHQQRIEAIQGSLDQACRDSREIVGRKP